MPDVEVQKRALRRAIYSNQVELGRLHWWAKGLRAQCAENIAAYQDLLEALEARG